MTNMATVSTEAKGQGNAAESKRPLTPGDVVRIVGFGTLCAAAATLAAVVGVKATSGNAEPTPAVCTYKVPEGAGVSFFAYRTEATIPELIALNGLDPRSPRLQEGAGFQAPCSDELEPYLAGPK